MKRRLRLLLSAYACEPRRGSEPGVGWNVVRQAALRHDAWILTRCNNRSAIERELHREPLPHAHWVYYDLPHWLRFWKRGQRGIHIYYYLWQIGAYFRARRLQNKIRFDVVHHITFANYWSPSALALLPAAFLWGPVGGGEAVPAGLWKTLSWRARVFEIARRMARWRGEHDPWVRLTARRSRVALASTRETAERLKRLGCSRVRIMGQAALAEAEIAELAARSKNPADSLRVLSVGRLIGWKGYHLAIEAFARLRPHFPGCSYRLIGEGPERRRLAKLARRRGVGESVRLVGNLPRERVLRLLSSADLLLHPSLHDSGGWACVEALAAGCPVVCLDCGGPAGIVSAECGIKVAASDPAQTIEGLVRAMKRLGADPRLRLRMGLEAQRRVLRRFRWEHKGDLLQDLYLRLAEEGSGP